MAKIGLKYPVYAIATETANAINYANGAAIAKAIQANISIEVNDVKLYADDKVAEVDKTFRGGTITMGIDDLSDAAKIALLGYTEGADLGETSGNNELSAGNTSEPASVGIGFYGKRVKDGTNWWRAVWIKKVQFHEPADEHDTKGESVEFKTPTLEGEIFEAADGKWKEEGTFMTEDSAIAWLNGKAGISSDASNNITALAVANGTLTPTFAAAKYLYSSEQTGNATITATFAAGTAKLYVDGSYVENLATTVASSSITMASGANKLVEIVVQESGKTAVKYTILLQKA